MRAEKSGPCCACGVSTRSHKVGLNKVMCDKCWKKEVAPNLRGKPPA